MRPFRFVVTAGTPRFRAAPPGSAWTALARRAEELGYDGLYVTDHLGRQLSPIPAMTAAAVATTGLRVGSFVFANDFRHPLLLAREAATVDVLSDGRLDLGMGAGWLTTDYRQLGLAYDPPPVRIDRLVEALDIMDRLFAGERVDHAGTHYTLKGARLAPRQVQRPRPRLLIGGGGPRMLRIAARRADIVGLLPQFDARGWPMVGQATEGATRDKAELVRLEAGDRAAELDVNVIVFDAGLVSRRAGALDAALAAVKGTGVALIGTPYVLYGTPARVRELLLQRRERTGINHYALPAHAMEAMAPLVAEMRDR